MFYIISEKTRKVPVYVVMKWRRTECLNVGGFLVDIFRYTNLREKEYLNTSIVDYI